MSVNTNPVTHLCFPEISVPSNIFCSEKSFAFGEGSYTNPCGCFYAQKYTDQPKLMPTVAKLNDPEERKVFFKPFSGMTEKRKAAWENPHDEHNSAWGVLMHVRRAQFGQIPELRDTLLKTDNLFLVCHGSDPVLSDGLNGTGQNLFGRSLMCLRKEYGGIGEVAPSASYKAMIERSQALVNSFPEDIWQHIVAQGDAVGVGRLSCVNTSLAKWAPKYASLLPFEAIIKACGPNLRVINTTGCKIHLPNPLELIKACHQLMPLVEGNAGLTLLPMQEGLTFNDLVQIAKDAGITVNIWCDQITKQLGHESIQQAYVVLITNNIFFNSRNTSYAWQQKLVRKVGCEMPELLEYVALCILTQMLTQKDGQVCLYGQSPWTYGRSATHIKGTFFVVGGSVPSRLCVDIGSYDANENEGTGGRWKLS